MKFVKDQEAQAFGVGDDLLINGVLPCQQQLQHHEVGQQDIRRVGLHGLALFGAFLPRETAEGYGPGSGVGTQKLLEFFQLAVGERVHGVDHDGAGAWLRIKCLGFQAGIHHRDEVRQ